MIFAKIHTGMSPLQYRNTANEEQPFLVREVS